MLIFTATTDKLQLVTENDQAIAVHASVADHTLSTDNYEAAVQNTSISSATTTDIVAAPSSGVTRNLKMLVVANNGTSPNVVTVRYNANGTTYDLFKALLFPKGALIYSDDIGFKIVSPSRADQLLVLGYDAFCENVTFRDVPDLRFLVTAGKTYWMDFALIISASVSTNGVRVGINGPASPTYLRLAGIGTKTASATAAVFTTQSATVSAYDTSFIASPVDSVAGNQSLAVGRGVIVPSASGLVTLRLQSETQAASGVVVRQGSFLRVREPDNV